MATVTKFNITFGDEISTFRVFDDITDNTIAQYDLTNLSIAMTALTPAEVVPLPDFTTNTNNVLSWLREINRIYGSAFNLIPDRTTERDQTFERTTSPDTLTATLTIDGILMGDLSYDRGTDDVTIGARVANTLVYGEFILWQNFYRTFIIEANTW